MKGETRLVVHLRSYCVSSAVAQGLPSTIQSTINKPLPSCLNQPQPLSYSASL